MNSNRVESVILAAGDSRRMGFPKALLPLEGGTFLSTILTRHRSVGLNPLVVLGKDSDRIRRRAAARTFQSVKNPCPEEGPLSSLRIALRGLQHRSAVLVHPVDHPLVSPNTLRSLISEHWNNRECIIIPRHCGKGGHPVLFPFRFYGELKEAPLSEGARYVVRGNRTALLYLDLDDPGILTNIDTLESYVELVEFPDLTSPAGGRSKVDRMLHLLTAFERAPISRTLLSG